MLYIKKFIIISFTLFIFSAPSVFANATTDNCLCYDPVSPPKPAACFNKTSIETCMAHCIADAQGYKFSKFNKNASCTGWKGQNCNERTGKCGVSSSDTDPTQAQANTDTGKSMALENPLGEINTIPKLIGNIVKAILGVVGSITLYMFVKGGATWLTAMGSEEKIKQGAKTLMWALLGAVIVFAGYVLVDFMIDFLTLAELK